MKKRKETNLSIKTNKKSHSITLSLKTVTEQAQSIYYKIKNKLGIFIAVFSFALYAQSITFSYTFDDSFIKDNNLVKKGFSAIPILLKTDQAFGLNDNSKRLLTYRPLPMVMHTLEWQLFPDNPHFYHLINILLYSLSCWLLFMLLCKLFENRSRNRLGGESLNLIFPFICTLLYTVHPIHTEVVDSIKSQDEILCFLFAIISIILFLKTEENKSIFKMVLAIIFFSLALFSKETGICYLIIIPLTLFVFSNMKDKKILFITFSLAIISGIFLYLHSLAMESIPQSRIDSLHTASFNSLVAAPDIITRKATAFYILMRYILLLIFPYQMSYDYSIAQIPLHQILSPGALCGILLYLVIGIYAFLKIRKKNVMAFAILFYLFTLAPVSNIFLQINCTMAERFLFTPSLGYCMVLALILIKITKTESRKIRVDKINDLIKNNSLLFGIVFIIAGLYSSRTIARNPDWKDNLTLFSHDVKIVPNSHNAHLFYGYELMYDLYPKEKNIQKQNNLLNNAVKEFIKAISIYNNLPIAYSYLGAAYSDFGDYKNAITHYEISVRLLSPLPPPSFVYCDLGFAYTKTGQYNKAINILDTSLKYYPNYLDAYVKKSYTYLTFGKNEEAIVESDKLLKIDTNNVIAYENKGCAYLHLKQYEKAIINLHHALRLDSTNADCLQYLGLAYKKIGDTIKSKQYFEN